MLKISHYVISIIVFIIAMYSLITKDFKYQSLMIFSLGLLMLVLGLKEFQQERKSIGWLSIITCIFILFVSIQGFLLS
ncbi:multisubunit Na+/H+ antiporter MnhE subunit [Cytobacillus purgationiresistens]|uniref:Multisubunit Na+/H+ antiporter MnhE subunit n=1 Tax=Cytobacillus purgationiresistens TaxID=863449 RepID=A0ABU0AQW7_9BACI|nr:multisubunit Na+/H+ antiporter MnhE subunit [Cytobacillus purgationiresistens]